MNRLIQRSSDQIGGDAIAARSRLNRDPINEPLGHLTSINDLIGVRLFRLISVPLTTLASASTGFATETVSVSDSVGLGALYLRALRLPRRFRMV